MTLARIDCTGAPRDLGLDQGRACRAAIRAAARALGGAPARRFPGWTRGGSALARDLARHFPHLDERNAGLARGAGLSDAALVALLAAELTPEAGPFAEVAFEAETAGTLCLALRDPQAVAGLVVRAVRPDGGHPNLSVTRPGLGAAWAGVNERGLAGAAELFAAPAPGERCQVPAMLLVEGCIERLDAAHAALEWCERRPGGGRARLLFADARGAVGAIEIDGEKRRRLDPAGLRRPAAAAQLRVSALARAIEIAVPGAPAAERFAMAAGS